MADMMKSLVVANIIYLNEAVITGVRVSECGLHSGH